MQVYTIKNFESVAFTDYSKAETYAQFLREKYPETIFYVIINDLNDPDGLKEQMKQEISELIETFFKDRLL